jgi:hypothetical protein
MALSYAEYVADGSTKNFSITVGYLQKSHMFVFVDGALAGYRWISPTSLELVNTPASGEVVRVARVTDKVNRITDFSDGQTLLAGDLDAATLQNFYICQELLDGVTDGILAGNVLVTNPNGSSVVTEQWINEQIEGASRSSPVILELLSTTDENGTSIAAESLARIAAIAAETQSRIDAVVAEAATRQAELSAEAAARAADVAAIQSQIDADLIALASTASALTQEITDRQTAVQENADALVAEALARSTGDTALQSNIDAVVASAGTNAAAIVAEQTARADADSANASALGVVSAALAATDATVASETTARVNADAAIASDVTSLQSSMGTAEANIIAANEAIATESSARATAVSGVQSDLGTAEAAIITNATAISDEATARATAVSGVQAALDDAEASIVAESTARSTGDSANANAIAAVSTDLDTAEAAIITNATAISDESSARASEVNVLEARLKGGGSDRFDFQSGFDDWNEHYQGSPLDILPRPTTFWTVVNDPVDGVYAATTPDAQFHYLSVRPVYQCIEGRRYRVTLRARYMGTGGLNVEAMSVFGRVLTANYDYAGDVLPVTVGTTALKFTSTGAWHTFTFEVSIDATAATQPYFRPSVYTRGDWVGHNGDVHFQEMIVEELGQSYLNTEASVVSEASARASADSAMASDISGLTTRMGGAEAAVITNAAAISDEASARASDVTALTTAFEAADDVVEASVVTEASARASADSAMASDISGLTTSMGDAEADIIANAAAISDETSARAAEFTVLQANFGEAHGHGSVRPTSTTWTTGQGPEGSLPDAPASWIGTDAAGLPYLDLPDNSSARSKSTYPWTAHSVYEAVYEVEAVSPATIYPQVASLDDTGTPLAGTWWTHITQGQLAVGRHTVTVVVGHTADPATGVSALSQANLAKNVRFGMKKTAGGEARILSLRVRDVAEGLSRVVTNSAAIVSEASARASADSAMASDISGLTTSMGDAEADIITNASAISDEESARAFDVNVLRAKMYGSSSIHLIPEVGLEDFQNLTYGDPLATTGQHWGTYGAPNAAHGVLAYAVPDGATFKYLYMRQTVPNVEGRRYRARVVMRYTGTDMGSGTAINGHFRSLSSSYGYVGAPAGFSFSFTTQYQWETVELEYTCVSAFTPYLRFGIYVRADWTGTNGHVEVRSMSVEEVGAVALDIEAQVATEASARTTADSANASDTTALTTRMGDAEADIVTTSAVALDAQGSANAMYALRQDVNGNISGFGLSNDGATSSFGILADQFLIADPSSPGDAPVAVFEVIGGVVHMTNAQIGSAVIGDATIGTIHMVGGSLGEHSIATSASEGWAKAGYPLADAFAIASFETIKIETPTITVVEGDRVKVEYSYTQEAEYNSFEWFSWKELGRVLTPGNGQVEVTDNHIRFMSTTSNTSHLPSTYLATELVTKSFTSVQYVDVPALGTGGWPADGIVKMELHLAANRACSSSASRCLSGGTYSTTKIAASLAASHISVSIQSIKDGPTTTFA